MSAGEGAPWAARQKCILCGKPVRTSKREGFYFASVRNGKVTTVWVGHTACRQEERDARR